MKITEKTEKTEKYLLQFKKAGTVIKLCTYFSLVMEMFVLFLPFVFFSVFRKALIVRRETAVAALW